MRRALATVLAAALLVAAGPPPGPAPAPSAAIAFQFPIERQIVFPITIAGKPAEAWLDSGAGATVVDTAFARRLGLSLGAPIQAHGVAGEVRDVRLAEADVTAGGLSMAGRRVVVMDLSGVQRMVQRPVQVLLGRDVFDQAVVDIDFAARTIRLLPRDGFVPPPEPPLPLKPSGDLRSVPISVRGVPMAAILDLGNAGGLLIDQSFAEHYALLKGRPLSTNLGVGADGAREELQASLDDLRVAGVRLDGAPVTATPNLASKAPANLGLQVLSRFHLVIDFAGDRIWMTPYPDAATRPFRKNRAGLVLIPQGGRMVVDYVAKASPAERAGWKKGEAIAAIDGRPVPDGFAGEEAALWVTGPAGQAVTLTMTDGRRRTLTLADYY